MSTLERLIRRLPNFKGKRRIARLFFGKKMREAKDLSVKGDSGCYYKLPNLSEYLAQEIFVNGIYEKETHQFLISRIPQNGTFLDLGANIGSIAIPLCKARKDVKCLAVEASPWIFEYLQHNVSSNGLEERITCINKAIADTEGGQMPFYSPTNQFGKGSFAPVFTDEAVMVDLVTIDSLSRNYGLEMVSMIKIDIEGFESFAFEGGAQLLKNGNAPDIIFEFVDWAEDAAGKPKGSAQRLLQQFGYNLYRMGPGELILSDRIQEKGDQLFYATKRTPKTLGI